MRRLFRVLWIGLILLVVVVLAGGFWMRLQLHGSLPQLDGELRVAGLASPVTVARDALGIPTIRAANRSDVARAMVFEFGMSDASASRTMRADNYALSEETKRLRDQEQARLTDEAYADAIRLLQKHRGVLDRIAKALLEKETLQKDELDALLVDVEQELRSAETVGTVRVVGAD